MSSKTKVKVGEVKVSKTCIVMIEVFCCYHSGELNRPQQVKNSIPMPAVMACIEEWLRQIRSLDWLTREETANDLKCVIVLRTGIFFG
jgi:hypothetical protein